VTAREGWNQHGWWIGDPANEPKNQAPPRAKCGGPNACRCGRLPRTFPTYGEFPTTPCKFCHAPIVWTQTIPNPNARTPGGKESKLIPMDAEPVDTTKFIITANPGDGRPLFDEMGTHNQAAGWRASGKKTYQKHVKTCTKVSLWPKGQFIVKQRQKGNP
jgi:hypothetical protein